MVAFNFTIVAQIINFFILLFLLDRLFFKKFAKLLADRRAFLSTTEHTVVAGLAELERLSKEHQTQIDAARQEAQAVIAAQLASAETEKTRILNAVRDELAGQQTVQKAELAEQFAAAEAQMRQEVGGIAEQIADKVMHVSRQPALR
ncbi:MAG: hypothetical protein H7338_04680 [Candidatus Sericytochromatia bacterium]|nr:hypothetical protein [Candidatus Sericytochromatia bacterium]